MKRFKDISIKYNLWILSGGQFEYNNYKKTVLRQGKSEDEFRILY